MTRRLLVAILSCSLAIGFPALVLGWMIDLRLLAIVVAVPALVAGFLLRERGVFAGFASVLLVALAWATYVLTQAWIAGDFARPKPDCDPCGVAGIVGRMAIVTVMALVTFGVLGAVAGGVGELLARRTRQA